MHPSIHIHTKQRICNNLSEKTRAYYDRNELHKDKATRRRSSSQTPFFAHRSPFDVFRDFFGDRFDDPFYHHFHFDINDPFVGRGWLTQNIRESIKLNVSGRYPKNIFNYNTKSYNNPYSKDENDCEYTSVIRFSSSCEPGKGVKKTTTSTRIVDGKKVVTKKLFEGETFQFKLLLSGLNTITERWSKFLKTEFSNRNL